MSSREALDFQVARMVLEYLGDKNLKRTREVFLEECTDLKDPLRFLDFKGFIITSLTDMLEEFLATKKSLDDIVFDIFSSEELPIYKTDGVLRKINVLKSHLKSKRLFPSKIAKETTPKKVYSRPSHQPVPRTQHPSSKSTPVKNAFINISSLGHSPPDEAEPHLRSPSSVSIRVTPLKDPPASSSSHSERPVRKRCLNFDSPSPKFRSQQVMKQYQMGLRVALTPYLRPNGVIVDLSAVPRSKTPRVSGASNTLNVICDVAHCLQLGAMVDKKDVYQSSSMTQ